MSFTIRYLKKGKPLTQHILEVQRLQIVTKQNLLTIAEATKNEMITIIDQNSKTSPSPNGLRNNIKVEKLANGYGIGRISDLPEWWAIINWGGNYIINAKNRVLKFIAKDGTTIYRKSVNHVVSARNYIERSISFLTTLLSTFKLGKK